MAGEEYICPRCKSGLEWGNIEKDNFLIWFWRCSHCGYKGDEIIRVPSPYKDEED